MNDRGSLIAFARAYPPDEPAGGGGGGNYYCTITRMIEGCNCLVAKAELYRIPCSGAKDPIGAEITIFDDLAADLPTMPAAEWIGAKAIVTRTKGRLTAYDESPVGDYCDADENAYTATDWAVCHYSIVRVACP